jgi:hypothetical protein
MSNLEVPKANSLGEAIRTRIAWATQRIPLSAPLITHNLTDLAAAPRVAEVLRYKILYLEFFVAPKGSLRVWLRLNLLLAIVLAIPTILVVPVVTWLMRGVATISEFILVATTNLLLASLAALGVAIVLSLLIMVVSAMSRHGGKF